MMTPYFQQPPTAAVCSIPYSYKRILNQNYPTDVKTSFFYLNEANVADGCEPVLIRQAFGSIIAHILMQPGFASDGLVWKNQLNVIVYV